MSEAPDAAGDSVDKLPAFKDNPTNVSGDDEKDSPRLPPLPTTAVGSTTLGGSSRGGDVSPLPNVGTPSNFSASRTPVQSSFNRTPARSSGSQAHQAYMQKKKKSALEVLNERNKQIIDEQAAQIKRLKEEVNHGKLQKQLQSVLLENHALRNEVQGLRAQGVQGGAKSLKEDYENRIAELTEAMAQAKEDQDAEIDRLNDIIQKQKEQMRTMDDQMDMRENTEEEHARSMDALNAELQRKTKRLDKLEAEVAAMRDGTRVEQLEEALAKAQQEISDLVEANKALEEERDELIEENEELQFDQEKQEETIARRLEEARAQTRRELAEKSAALEKAQAELVESQRRQASLEAAAAESNIKVVRLKQDMSDYEKGWKIEDAMKQIRLLKAQISDQQEDAETMKDRVNDLYRENRILRQKANVPDSWGLSAEDYEQYDQQVNGLQNQLKSERQVREHLENERLRLLEELRLASIHRNEAGQIDFLGLDEQQTASVFQYAELLRQGDSRLPVSDNSRQLEQKLRKKSDELVLAKAQAVELRKRVRALEHKLADQGGDPKQLETIMNTLQKLQSKGNEKAVRPRTPARTSDLAGVLDSAERLSSGDQIKLLRRLQQRTGVQIRGDTAADSTDNEFAQLRGFRVRVNQHDKAAGPFDPDEYRALTEVAEVKVREQKIPTPDDPTAPPTVPQQPAPSPVTWADLVSPADRAQGRLMGCIKDLLECQAALSTANDELDRYKRMYASLAVAQQLLYAEHTAHQENWNSEREALRTQLEDARDGIKELRNAQEESERLGMASSDEEKIRILQTQLHGVQEEAMKLERSARTMEEELKLRAEQQEVDAEERLALERRTKERMLLLVHARDEANSRARQLAQQLIECVPKTALMSLARQHQLLRQQHARLLFNSSEQAVRYAELTQATKKNAVLASKLRSRDDDLAILNQQVTALESTVAELRSLSTGRGGDDANSADDALQKRVEALSRLEIEKYKLREADHLKHIARLQGDVKRAQEHVDELMQDTNQKREQLEMLRRADLDHRQEITKLKSQVEHSIPLKEANQLRYRCSKLSEQCDKLRADVTRYKEQADVAAVAAQRISEQTDLRHQEMELLRDMLTHVSRSDTHMDVGIQSRQLIAARIQKKEAERKLEHVIQEKVRLEAALLQAESALDERHREFYHAMSEYHSKLAHRERLIVELQSQVDVGGLTLEQAEVLHGTNARLAAELDKERVQAEERQQRIESLQGDVRKLEAKVEGQEELKRMIGAGSHAFTTSEAQLKAKLLEWHQRVLDLRVAQLQSESLLAQRNASIEFLKARYADAQAQLGQLQERIVERDNRVAEKELEWKKMYTQMNVKERELEARERKLRNRIKTLAADPSAVTGAPGASGADAKAREDREDAQARLEVAVVEELEEKLKRKTADYELHVSKLETELSLLRSNLSQEREAYAKELQIKQQQNDHIREAAHATIMELSDEVKRKDADIEKTQELLDGVLEKYRAHKELDTLEIARLNKELLERGRVNLGQLQGAVHALDTMPRVPRGVVPLERVEEILSAKTHELAVLTTEYEQATQQLEDAKHQIDELQATVQQLQSQVKELQDSQGPSAKLRGVVKKLRDDMHKKELEMKNMESAVDKLKQLKTEVLQAYDDTVDKTADSKVDPQAANLAAAATQQLSAEKLKWQRKIKSLQNHVQQLQGQIRKVNAEHSTCKDTFAQKDKALKGIKKLVHQRELEIKELQQKHSELKADYEEYKEKQQRLREIRRLGQSPKHKRSGGRRGSGKKPGRPSTGQGGAAPMADVPDVSDPRLRWKYAMLVMKERSMAARAHQDSVRIRELAEANVELKEQLDQIERDQRLGRNTSSAARARWEDRHKFERRIASLKKKLADRSAALDESKGEIEQVKKVQEEQSRELADTKRQLSEAVFQLNQAKELGGRPLDHIEDSMLEMSLPQATNLEEARQELYMAQEKIGKLRHEIEAEHKPQMVRLRALNHKLSRQLKAAVERGLGTELKSVELMPSESRLKDLLEEKENQLMALEEERVDLQAKNLELNFMVEQHDVEASSLRQRVQQLNAYVNHLKQHVPSNAALDPPTRDVSTKARGSSGDAAKKRAVEMKKALETMKEVISRLRSENESLKRSSQSTSKYMEMVHETKRLKKRIQEMVRAGSVTAARSAEDRPKSSSAAAAGDARRDRRGSGSVGGGGGGGGGADAAAGVAGVERKRLMQLNRQMRKTLKRETLANERLREQLAGANRSLDELRQENEHLKQELNQAVKSTEATVAHNTRALRQAVAELEQTAKDQEAELKEKHAMLAEVQQQMNLLTSKIQELQQQRAMDKPQEPQHGQDSQKAPAQAVHTEEQAKYIAQLNYTVQNLTQVNSQLKAENDALKKELSAFDLSFFDEIEDLKYRYSQNVQELERARATIAELQGRRPPAPRALAPARAPGRHTHPKPP